jgi:hypothetical protein
MLPPQMIEEDKRITKVYKKPTYQQPLEISVSLEDHISLMKRPLSVYSRETLRMAKIL